MGRGDERRSVDARHWFTQETRPDTSMNQARRFTLGHGIVVSLAMHVCIVLPVVAWMLYSPRPTYRSTNRLNVQMVGLIANRQTAAQQKRIETPVLKFSDPKHESIDKKPTPAQKEPVPTEPLTPHIEPSATTPDSLRLPLTASSPREVSNSSGARPQAGADTAQPQQRIAAHNDMNDRIAAYMAQLTKLLQSNLIYPQDAKKKKIEGTSLVSFVIAESGEIQPNSLVVKRSSGSAALDASALRTVASSAPFQRPPKELNVSIELEFEVDSKIF
jgi:protein TonB